MRVRIVRPIHRSGAPRSMQSPIAEAAAVEIGSARVRAASFHVPHGDLADVVLENHVGVAVAVDVCGGDHPPVA